MTPERTEKGIAYLTRTRGRWHPDTVEARLKTRYWLVADGDPAAALRSAETEVAERTAESGADHPETFEARRNFNHFHDEMHGKSATVPLMRVLTDDMTRALGPGHTATLGVRRWLAYRLRDEGLLTESIVESRAMLGELEGRPGYDKDLRGTWYVLASALEMAGERAEALIYVEKELESERGTIYGIDENIGEPYKKSLESWRDRLR